MSSTSSNAKTRISKRLRLVSGAAEVVVAPEFGGSLLAWSVDGVDVLRRASPMPATPLDTTCFPLVPFANRIRNGSFTADQRAVNLGPSWLSPPHAIHGHGWERSWDVVRASADMAILGFTHVPDAWPWAYSAWQRISVAPRTLEIELGLRNCSNERMPAGLGLHPYLPRDSSAVLRFASARVALVSHESLPVGHEPSRGPFDFSAGRRIGEQSVDTCFFGWDGIALIARACGVVRIEATGCTALHVYTPSATDFCCVEPVTHAPDAANSPHSSPAPMAMLSPGEQIRICVVFHWVPTPV